jgi:hypothetical protein
VGVQLGSFGIEYKPRTAIKGQVLADFIAEFQQDPWCTRLEHPSGDPIQFEAVGNGNCLLMELPTVKVQEPE